MPSSSVIELQPKDSTMLCDSCGRPSSEDELSECCTCHERFCSACHECACDKLAEHLLARVVDRRRNQSLFARVKALFFRPA